MKITRTVNVVKILADITAFNETITEEKLLTGNVNIRQAINAFRKDFPDSAVISGIQIIPLGEKKYSMELDKFIEYATVEED